MTILRTVDAHTGGEPLRLVVEGFPEPQGRTMLEKREWVREHCDHLRTAIMLEPRGHADMYGALLTAPERPDSDAGVLFMHNAGYSTMCGHGIIAVTMLVLERRLATTQRPNELVLDSPAGQIRARARRRDETPDARVTSVSFQNVPSFVLYPAVAVRVNGRELRADVAFGGAFYAIVDSEAAGIPIIASRLDDLRRIGMAIKHAVEAVAAVEHPLEPGLRGIYGTIFTGPASSPAADLRNVTIFAEAEVDRSPCGTGTCAVMSVLAAMGLLGPERTFTHESIINSRFQGRVVCETMVGDLPAIVPEIEGEAFITGEHTFLLEDNDSLRHGFRL
jgi:trans-L-3-hydroxyproline dehydratase